MNLIIFISFLFLLNRFWDDWMRKPEQRRNRACIRPEVSRTGISPEGKKGVSGYVIVTDVQLQLVFYNFYLEVNIMIIIYEKLLKIQILLTGKLLI